MATGTLTAVCWNLERNGIDPDGSTRRRKSGLAALERISPHILFRQEASNDHRIMREEANRLQMDYSLPPVSPEGNSLTAVLWDPQMFVLEREKAMSSGLYKPMTVPTVRLKGTTTSLALASTHLCWCDPTMRATAARRLTELGEHGRTALFGGDWNSYPHRAIPGEVPLPNWHDVEDRVHYEHRTIERNGQRVSDTLPDEILAGQGVFIELGHYAATVLGQPRALEPTASLWRTDQGGMTRIDRIYCTTDIASALRSLEVIADHEVREASDHAMVVARFDLGTLRKILSPETALAAA